MKRKFKVKVVFEWEYEADPKWYAFSVGKEDPKEMINIDKKAANDDIYFFIDGCENEPIIEIKDLGPVK